MVPCLTSAARLSHILMPLIISMAAALSPAVLASSALLLYSSLAAWISASWPLIRLTCAWAAVNTLSQDQNWSHSHNISHLSQLLEEDVVSALLLRAVQQLAA